MVNDSNGVPPPQELETFLSPDEKNKEKIVSTKYNMTTKDVESGDFDPFTERKLENPTSNNDTLTHLLKASLGTGILAMPKAFKAAGLVNGIFFTILVALVCTHCAYILIKCAHVLYKKTRKTNMSFPEVGEASFENGPEWIRAWANPFRIFILVSLFLTYFGTCSVYTVIIAQNILQVAAHYMNVTEQEIEIRIFIIALLLPLILMVWIRNLKYLAPVSMLANFLMAVGLGITFYYLVGTGGLDFSKVKMFKPPVEWPEFFSLTIFAMEAIGVVMPLENAMKTPRAMLGCCGVLNKGMSGVTLVYILLGFLGYLRYGDEVADAVTLNLDQTQIPAQIVKLSIAVAVYCTFGLQFFVCVDIMWNCIKDKFTKRPDLADYIMRTILVTLCVLLAVAVPTIGPFMGVIGAFCFSLLGLIAPAFIEIITFWDIGFGRGNFLIWKNVFVFIFGLFALVFGSKDAIISIIEIYSK
ncbi:proton-coupled amino acid transporter-like protein pathetic [Pectinophora gossypiella]|uniref:Amino acid transporter transmembrane domain-containing protein n=1 Tax=Pectinophora gossypiella TaxID=13191 RepID=A0A1E1W1L5_PECGO|nr:proton-coupled amino acid transporter-like protein pathetic [Pectinophora gossypiella]XP_049884771.1 proton-coupled amino acid transporter-like protein pathetic [Pectinophora gossypiella]